ncbi:MAG TPA: winged helix-turn-helix transcriptional regulator [Erythrobacter sp.]|nr:winged helix-turn-helix transcriptional regulator [Erythrobacter sp.]
MKLPEETKTRSTPHGRWYDDACGTAFALEVLGERWAMLIVRELMLGARRFSDIRASLPGISAKVLTERLAGLEASGVVLRRRLPPPASTQVYELTEWGYRAEPVMQALGRWAASSPLHDPSLPMSAVSMMLSLRTMFDPARVGDRAAWIGFDIAGDTFLARLNQGRLEIARRPLEKPDFAFAARDAQVLVALFYGKVDPARLEATGALAISGDRAAALEFVGLFELPKS